MREPLTGWISVGGKLTFGNVREGSLEHLLEAVVLVGIGSLADPQPLS